MASSSRSLVFELRDRGKVVSTPSSREIIYELDGKLYRCTYIPERERQPREMAWRAEQIESSTLKSGSNPCSEGFTPPLP